MKGELWRLFTYQFLHANLGHIMFNMIALWFFGPVVEERFAICASCLCISSG